MENLIAPVAKPRFVVTDSRGQRVTKPAAADVENAETDLVINGVEVALIEVIRACNGLVRSCGNVLGIEDGIIMAHAKLPKQGDLDLTLRATFATICEHVVRGLRKAQRVKRCDPELAAGRNMLLSFYRALRMVRPRIDAAPGIILANEFTVCCYMLIGASFTDEARSLAVQRWEIALQRHVLAIQAMKIQIAQV